MKTFGWVYVVAYCLDALAGLVASVLPQAESLSNLISAPVSLLSVVVLILAALGRMTPRKIFLALSGFYVLLMGFGIVLAVLVVAKLGPSAASQEITLAFLRDQFAWYGPLHWILMIAWLLVAGFGFHAYLKAASAVETPTEAGGEARGP